MPQLQSASRQSASRQLVSHLVSHQFVDHKGHVITLGSELGRGGQGTVYKVAGQPKLVAKVYLRPPSQEQVHKLEALVKTNNDTIATVSAWPLATLYDYQGHSQGYLMPQVDLREYHELHALYSPGSRRKYFAEVDWSFLVHTARNVARAFATLHAAGHLMGDVSGRNILVSSQGMVRIIDTDSFQVRYGSEVFPCPVGTAEFTPPELQGQNFGTFIRHEQHDRFGLALLIFHLLFEGRHPYAGIHAGGKMLSPAQAIAANAFAYSAKASSLKQPPGTRAPKRLATAPATAF